MQENPNFITQKPVSTQENSSTKKEKPVAFLLSLVLFILVVGFGGAMTFLNFKTKSDIAQLEEQTAEVNRKIQTYKENVSVNVAMRLQSNELKKGINIKTLVEEFKDAAIAEQVFFQGFSVKDNQISTTLISEDYTTDAVGKIISMMKKYESINSQKNFALSPIMSVAGTARNRTTPIIFNIIDKTKETVNTPTVVENSENTESSENN